MAKFFQCAYSSQNISSLSFSFLSLRTMRGKKRGRKKRRRALYNSFSCSLTQLSRRRLYVRIDSLSLFKTTLSLFSRAIFLEAKRSRQEYDASNMDESPRKSRVQFHSIWKRCCWFFITAKTCVDAIENARIIEWSWSEDGGNDTVEASLWFIPISQPVAEI